MQIEIKIDETCKDPKIIVIVDKMNDEINELVKRLSEERPQIMVGFQGDVATVLSPDEIYRVFAAGGKVYAETSDGQYALRMRLYEVEERLTGSFFTRISNSEIVNLKRVRRFDLSFAGTICVILTNGTTTYASRRYVAKIKQVLGM